MTLNLADYVGREDEIEHIRGNGIQGIVHCPHAGGDFSRIAVVFKNASCGTYSTSGHSYASSKPWFKLKPKKHELDFWINIYPSVKYHTKEEALQLRNEECIATINVKRTITEGEIDE